MMVNEYTKQIEAVLPRVLSLFDHNITNPYLGVGDRLFWSWKLTDFPNATSQGAAHGLAIILELGLFESKISKKNLFEKICQIIRGTSKVTRTNGSLEEAFPYESSYCVTALVAYDLISALLIISSSLNERELSEFRAIIQPLINFLIIYDEEHAVITNHLATAVAALVKWEVFTNTSPIPKRLELTQRIIDKQFEDGSFNEYGGADPGYQSLAVYYLADANQFIKSDSLHNSIVKSLEFTRYSIHPNGSFGGVYGSRNTRFYYPGGYELLASIYDCFKSVALNMRGSIEQGKCVNLLCMDTPNLIPMFNSYCFAAKYFSSIGEVELLPHQSNETFSREFGDAGVIFYNTDESYSWLSQNKGAAFGYYEKNKGKVILDYGALYELNGRFYSSQSNVCNIVRKDEEELVLEVGLSEVNHIFPDPLKFLVLRVLNISIMRIRFFSELIKKSLVFLLITNQKNSVGIVRREFKIKDGLGLFKETSNNSTLSKVNSSNPHYCIHMASQGYWQVSDGS